MDTDQLIAHARSRFDHAAARRALKEKYQAMLAQYKSLGGSNWQYADREQNLSSAEREARSMEPALRNLASKIARAEKAQGEVDEAAPFLAKAAGGIIGGAIGVLGAPGIVAILGPLLGIPFAAYGAYTTSKVGMRGVEKLWDMAAKKLGGDDEVSQYVDSNINKLPPEQAKAAADVAKKLSETRAKTAEDHSTMTQGYGRESASTGQAFAGRMKGAIPEDAYFEELEALLEEKVRLDPKCWKGKHKEGTKIKGGVRVNNCVPNEDLDEAGSAAQQAAIAISMKKAGKKPKSESIEEDSIPGTHGDWGRTAYELCTNYPNVYCEITTSDAMMPR